MLYSRQDASQRAILRFIPMHEEGAIAACSKLVFPSLKLCMRFIRCGERRGSP